MHTWTFGLLLVWASEYVYNISIIINEEYCLPMGDQTWGSKASTLTSTTISPTNFIYINTNHRSAQQLNQTNDQRTNIAAANNISSEKQSATTESRKQRQAGSIGFGNGNVITATNFNDAFTSNFSYELRFCCVYSYTHTHTHIRMISIWLCHVCNSIMLMIGQHLTYLHLMHNE